MRRPRAGGGWKSIAYSFGKARQVGGLLRLYRALRSKNTCKTCALGMGGQAGGMRNELGRFPEVCKKSIQAMAADMQGRIREGFFDDFSLEQLAGFSSRELEASGRLVEPVVAGPLDGHYRLIGWDEALDRIAAKLAKTKPDNTFFYSSGRSSNALSSKPTVTVVSRPEYCCAAMAVTIALSIPPDRNDPTGTSERRRRRTDSRSSSSTRSTASAWLSRSFGSISSRQ